MEHQNAQALYRVHRHPCDPANNSAEENCKIKLMNIECSLLLTPVKCGLRIFTLGCTRYVSTHSTFNGTVSTMNLYPKDLTTNNV